MALTTDYYRLSEPDKRGVRQFTIRGSEVNFNASSTTYTLSELTSMMGEYGIVKRLVVLYAATNGVQVQATLSIGESAERAFVPHYSDIQITAMGEWGGTSQDFLVWDNLHWFFEMNRLLTLTLYFGTTIAPAATDDISVTLEGEIWP